MKADDGHFVQFNHPQLLRYTKTLFAKYELERQKRVEIELDRNHINTMLRIARDQLAKNEADRTNTRDMTEAFNEQIGDMERQVRLLRFKNIIEDAKTVDRMREEMQDIVADVSRQHQDVVNEQHWQNKNLKEIMKAHNDNMRNQTKHIKLQHVQLLKNWTNKASAHTTRAIQMMEDNRLVLLRDIEKAHDVEMNEYRLWYRGDLLNTIAAHSKDINRLHETYRMKTDEQLNLIKQLKYELENNINNNLKRNQGMVLLMRENKDLKKINVRLFEKIKNLEDKLLKYDNCVRIATNFSNKIQQYTDIIEKKNGEIMYLKHEIDQMNDGYQNYDDYHINLLLEMQSTMTY